MSMPHRHIRFANEKKDVGKEGKRKVGKEREREIFSLLLRKESEFLGGQE